MTFADFETLPATAGKQELIDGEVLSMPPCEIGHAVLTKRVFSLLAEVVEPRAWMHAGYRIGPGWIQPDVSLSWPDQREDEKYLVSSPMVAVEILSPGEEIERKLTLYFADGALEVWVIDRKHRTMTVSVRRGGEVLRFAVEDRYTSDAAGVTVVLDQLFRS